ncbi:MAG: hypothetical protein GQ469_08470 [Methanosarcinales archaeon]|nr:hypothetical protein [Methanosarcinales archaeon]
MAASEFGEKEPQMNADERRFNPATYIIAVHRKGRKERKAQPQCRTRIGRIFTDNFNPCASVQSVFHHVCSSLKNPASETEVSAFIRVHLWLIFIDCYAANYNSYWRMCCVSTQISVKCTNLFLGSS